LNPQERNSVEDYKEGREITLKQANIAIFPTEVTKEPMNFDEAWNFSGKLHQIKWLEAINKQLNEMKNKGVWEVIDSNDITNDRRCIKCKWIFKVKTNEIFREKIVE
jgi:hypothetical protein